MKLGRNKNRALLAEFPTNANRLDDEPAINGKRHFSALGVDVCDFAAILNAFRDQSGTVRDETNAHGTPNEGRARRPLPRAEFWKEHA